MPLRSLVIRRGRSWDWRVSLACFSAGTLLLCAHGDLQDRIAHLDRKLAVASDRPELWLQRADLRWREGELSAAMADADEALRRKPGWPRAALQRARILLDQNCPLAAKQAADDCLMVEPENAEALVLRARCHAGLADTNAAIQDLDTVLTATHQTRPDLYLERARLQAALGHFASAVHGLDEGMMRLGRTPSLAIPAVEYARRAGDSAGALRRVDQLQPFMRRESWLVLKGELQNEAGYELEAGETLRAALQLLNNLAPNDRLKTKQQELKRRALAGLDPATTADHGSK